MKVLPKEPKKLELTIPIIERKRAGIKAIFSWRGVELAHEYYKKKGILRKNAGAERLHSYCTRKDEFRVLLEFTPEKPIFANGVILYCLQEIGEHASGDYYWFSLEQLIICE